MKKVMLANENESDSDDHASDFESLTGDDSPTMEIDGSGDEAVTADRGNTGRRTKVKRGDAVRSGRIARKLIELEAAKLAHARALNTTVQGGDSDADSEPDDASDAYFDAVLKELELGGLSDDDDGLYTAGDVTSEDDEPVRRTGAPEQMSEVQKTLMGRKGDVDAWVEGDFVAGNPTMPNPGHDAEKMKYENYSEGLSGDWFTNGDPTLDNIFDPVWLLFHFVSVLSFKKMAVRTDAKQQRVSQLFKEAELKKQEDELQKGKSYTRKKQRRWKPIGDNWHLMVRYFGVVYWRSTTKQGRSDHANAFTKNGPFDNAGNFDQHVADTMPAHQWVGIKSFFCGYDATEVAPFIDPQSPKYDPLAKVSDILNEVRGNAERLMNPTEFTSADESTYMCGTYGGMCILRQIRGKSVASNGFQLWMLAFKYHSKCWLTKADHANDCLKEVNVAVPATWVVRLVPHRLTGHGGQVIIDPDLGLIGNGMLNLYARLHAANPDRIWGTTFFDNLFPSVRFFAWLIVVFGEKFCCTLNGNFQSHGAKSILAQLPDNKTDRKITVLRELPPQVGWKREVTIMSCFDTGFCRMATCERGKVFEFVTFTQRRRLFLKIREKYKIASLQHYSDEMNAVDLVDARLQYMLLTMQSWNMSQMSLAGVLAHAAHVMLVERHQKKTGEFHKPPMNAKEFRERLGMGMMRFTAEGKYEGESPKKTPAREDKAGPAVKPPSAMERREGVHNPEPSGKRYKQICAYCGKKSAVSKCSKCGVHLHAPTNADGCYQNTAGQQWPCFGEYHSDHHEQSYEVHKKTKSKETFKLPGSVAKVAKNTNRFNSDRW